MAESLRVTAAPHQLEVTQKALSTFDREAAALYVCASQLTRDQEAAEAAVHTVIRAFWTALRERQSISDARTWLLLSLSALLFPASKTGKRWSFTREHPPAKALEGILEQTVSAHVNACPACFGAWASALHGNALRSGQPDLPASLRSRFVHDLESPDEAALFLSLALRQAAMIRFAAPELGVLLGDRAQKEWFRREGPASVWLNALLGVAEPAAARGI